jgi:hypothetical protein
MVIKISVDTFLFSDNIMTDIAKLFYDPNTGLISASKLYKKLKAADSNVTMKEVKAFVDAQYVHQITLPVKKPKQYSNIFAPYNKHNYQMDIIVYDRYTFHNYKYILVVIDVHSRYVMAKAMTNRTGATIMKNIRDIFDQMGYPQNMNCDNEFNTKGFRDLAKQHNIHCWFSLPDEPHKNSIVERFNRTLAQLLQKWRITTGRYDWSVILPTIIDNYNSTYHTTLKAIPRDVWNGLDYNHQIPKVIEHKFHVGDVVRVRYDKQIFDKGDVISYSKETHQVERITRGKIYLQGVDQFFKPEQLSLVRGEVQHYQQPESEHEPVHQAIQKKRKLVRDLNKEGIVENQVAIRRNLRERKPNQLVHDQYGRVFY